MLARVGRHLLPALLVASCAAQPTETDLARQPITAEFDRAAGEHIQKRFQAAQAASDRAKACDELFDGLRIGARVRNDGPMAKCADISYTKTLRSTHEVWTWKSGARSIFVDNGIVTTINGTLPSAPE